MLVLDINLPGRSGLDVLHALKDETTAMRVLVVSMYPEDQYAIRALRAGAFGYVNKGGDPQLIVSAVRTVAQGRKYVTPEIAQMLVESLTAPTIENAHDKLSDRETADAGDDRLGQAALRHRRGADASPEDRQRLPRARAREARLTNNSEMTVYAIRNGLVGTTSWKWDDCACCGGPSQTRFLGRVQAYAEGGPFCGGRERQLSDATIGSGRTPHSTLQRHTLP